MGASNYLGSAYMSFPIAITVEGANIMTRSFQIIGQGLMRCHPHLLDVVEALQSDSADAPANFMKGVKNMASHGATNFGRSVVAGVKDAVSFKGGEVGQMYHTRVIAQHAQAYGSSCSGELEETHAC